MKTLSVPEQKIPIACETDLLVLGSGPAGFSAAVCAAREGVRTMLIEQGGDVGGMATAGMMSHWTGDTKGGFYEELLLRTAELSNEIADESFGALPRQIINPETLKTAMLDLLCESGVNLRLYTFAAEPILEDGVLKGVICQSKNGREAFLAKIIIDATGDGDIAALSGAPYYKGRETDGKMQPATLLFKVGGVDISRAVLPCSFEDNLTVPKGKIQDLGRANLPFPAGHVLLYRSTLPGIVTCNMTNCIDIDGTSADDLTKATLACHRQIPAIVKFLRDFVPGFETCYILSSASFMGIRETRHFIGEASLCEEDILTAKQFEDRVVADAHFNFDVHNLSGNGLDETGCQNEFSQTKGYTIPYGCLVPKKIDNLLLAGRNISGTHMAHSNYRVMPICVNIGQAAGIAASLCIKKNCKPRDLNIRTLQLRLSELGVLL